LINEWERRTTSDADLVGKAATLMQVVHVEEDVHA